MAGMLKDIKENATNKVFVNSEIPSNTNNPAARPRPVVSSKNKCVVAEKKKLIHTLKNKIARKLKISPAVLVPDVKPCANTMLKAPIQ